MFFSFFLFARLGGLFPRRAWNLQRITLVLGGMGISLLCSACVHTSAQVGVAVPIGSIGQVGVGVGTGGVSVGAAVSTGASTLVWRDAQGRVVPVCQPGVHKGGC